MLQRHAAQRMPVPHDRRPSRQLEPFPSPPAAQDAGGREDAALRRQSEQHRELVKFENRSQQPVMAALERRRTSAETVQAEKAIPNRHCRDQSQGRILGQATVYARKCQHMARK